MRYINRNSEQKCEMTEKKKKGKGEHGSGRTRMEKRMNGLKGFFVIRVSVKYPFKYTVAASEEKNCEQ